MSKKKKVRIVVIVVVLFLLVQLVLAGLLGGLGPLAFLRDVRLRGLPGNDASYAPDTVSEMENSPLRGKTVCFLGSSVTEGSASLGNSMAEYLGKRFGCEAVVEAVSGTTLADTGKSSYVQRLLGKLDANAPFSMFICQLSTNDASKKLPLGTVSESRSLADFDTATVAGAMEYIICYAQETWNCPVLFYTGARYDSAPYAEMVALLPALQEKWGVGVIDLWHSDAFNDISAQQRKLYMNDDIHPTMAGYRDWWTPEMERQILDFLNER